VHPLAEDGLVNRSTAGRAGRGTLHQATRIFEQTPSGGTRKGAETDATELQGWDLLKTLGPAAATFFIALRGNLRAFSSLTGFSSRSQADPCSVLRHTLPILPVVSEGLRPKGHIQQMQQWP